MWSQKHPLPMRPNTTLLAVGGIIGLVTLRQILTLEENDRLTTQRQAELTEWERAEEALRQSELRMKTVLESV